MSAASGHPDQGSRAALGDSSTAPGGSRPALAGVRPALVFLHGIGGGHAGFDAHVAYFNARGWRALAWDQCGYGDSPDLQPYTFAGMAQALAQWLNAARVESVVLVGHSMGGMIALEFYAAFAPRVVALVLANSSPAFGNSSGDFQRQFVAARTRPLDEGKTMADVAQALVPAMLGGQALPSARAEATTLMAGVRSATYRKALAELVRFDRRPLLPTIAVPVLCLAAEDDKTAPPAVLSKMAEKIPGARYECLPGLGHLAPLEHPARFCAAIETFIAGSLR